MRKYKRCSPMVLPLILLIVMAFYHVSLATMRAKGGHKSSLEMERRRDFHDPKTYPTYTDLETSKNYATESAIDPTHQTTIDPSRQTTSDPKRQTTIDPKHQTTIDPSRQTTIDPKRQTTSDPERQTTINPERQTTTDPTRQTTIDSKRKTTNDPESQTTIDTKRETNTIDPKRLTAMDSESLSPNGRENQTAINDELKSSISQVDRDCGTNKENCTSMATTGTHENVTGNLNNATEDRISCGVDVSLYTCMDNTCQGRCGEVNNYTHPYWFCSCDDACRKYGDCCKDFYDICGDFNSTLQPEEEFTCLSIGSGKYVYVKQSCQSGYNNKSIAQKCLAARGLEEKIPVTDPLTNVVYANYFCALCNMVNHSIITWDISVRCKLTPPVGKTMERSIIDILKIDVITRRGSCLISKVPSFKGSILRFCIPVSNDCPVRCYNSTIVEACKTGGRDPQYLRFGGTFLRNAHCLQCHNENGRECPRYDSTHNAVEIMRHFSYSILVNGYSDSGMAITIKSKTGFVGANSSMLVKDGNKRILHCPNQFKLVEGECVLNETLIDVLCMIPASDGNNTERTEKDVANVISKLFNIIGHYVVKVKPDGFVYCKLVVTIPDDVFNWRVQFDQKEKIIRQNFPPSRDKTLLDGKPYCVFEKVSDTTNVSSDDITVRVVSTKGKGSRGVETSGSSPILGSRALGLTFAPIMLDLIDFIVQVG